MDKGIFYDYFDIATEIVKKAQSLGKFRKFLISGATDTNQVFSLLEAQVARPVLIVCLGETEYDDDCLGRTIRPLLIVGDEFKKGSDDQAKSIWTLLHELESLFLPQRVENGNLEQPDIFGIEFRPTGTTPIGGGSETLSAYSITIQGHEYLRKDNQ